MTGSLWSRWDLSINFTALWFRYCLIKFSFADPSIENHLKYLPLCICCSVSRLNSTLGVVWLYLFRPPCIFCLYWGLLRVPTFAFNLLRYSNTVSNSDDKPHYKMNVAIVYPLKLITWHCYIKIIYLSKRLYFICFIVGILNC